MFKDRKEAGQLLAKRLSSYKNNKNTLVLAIPRGGIIVAHEVAKQLGLPLDVVVIKKIGFPGNEELAIGAVGLNNYFINEDLVKYHNIPKDYIHEQIKEKQLEVKKRYELFRGKRSMYSVKDKTIIIIDDGIATGATITIANKIIKKQLSKKLIIAVPVAPPETVDKLKKVADEVVCLLQPEYLMAIGQFYQDFKQVEDEEVKKLLEEANK